MRMLSDPVSSREFVPTLNISLSCLRRISVWIARANLTRFRACVLLIIAIVFGDVSHATEIIRWQRRPIEVKLHVGQERIMFVDRSMRVGVPTALVERLRVQSADGAVYWFAKDAFPPTRVELRDVDTGVLVLLDIQAAQGDGQEPLEPLQILLGKSAENSSNSDSQGSESNSDETHGATRPTPSVVLLTRYAAQSLYAPLRTVESVPGIVPIPVHPILDLSSLLPSLTVNLNVLAAWKLQDQWVTAVRITNHSADWLSLDPRALQGDFSAATFQHQQLGPQGESTDTTVVYLVTQGHGLAESLLPALSPIDAARDLRPPAPVGSAHEE